MSREVICPLTSITKWPSWIYWIYFLRERWSGGWSVTMCESGGKHFRSRPPSSPHSPVTPSHSSLFSFRITASTTETYRSTHTPGWLWVCVREWGRGRPTHVFNGPRAPGPVGRPNVKMTYGPRCCNACQMASEEPASPLFVQYPRRLIPTLWSHGLWFEFILCGRLRV